MAHLKLLIARLKHDRFGASSERGRKLIDQMELQLEELEAAASEATTVAALATGAEVTSFTRRKPARAPLPAHLPRERVVIAAPSACPCCGGKLAKLGEDITETLEVIPPPMEGGADRARKIHLPVLRGDHPAARALPPDRAGSGGSEPAGDDPGCQVRPAPAAQPAERGLWP